MKAENFQGTVSKYMKIRHVRTREQLRAHTTVGSSTTFRKYFNDPDLMPIGVFKQIMIALKVPQEEQTELFKGGNMIKALKGVIALIIIVTAVFLSQPTESDLVLEYEEIPVVIETIEIEVPEQETEEVKVNEFTYEEAQLLLKIAQAEAGNQGIEGMRLVMSVIINRVDSEDFPGTIYEVVSQKNQFTTYRFINRVEPCAECHEALARIERGEVEPEIIGFERVENSSLEKYFDPVFSYMDHRFYRLKERS